MDLADLGRQLRDKLGPDFGGSTVVPGDSAYEQTRKVWNATVDKHPAMIARCGSTDQVAAAVRAARDVGVPLSVRGGGHQVAGLSVCDDGLTIDLGGFRSVELATKESADRNGRGTVRVGGGALLGDVDRGTQRRSRIVPAGVISHTGLGGLALGGGVGWTCRHFGLTCDNIVRAEVVTADGSVRIASAESDPDLLYALRGGGGNFGAVTTFEMATYPVRDVLLGRAVFARQDLPRAVAHYRDTLDRSPRELTSVLVLRVAPDIPGVPRDIVGQPAVVFNAVWSGDLAAGDAPMRALVEGGGPRASILHRESYLKLQSMQDDLHPHGLYNYMKSRYLDRLDDVAISALYDAAAHPAGAHSQIEVLRLGGAIADVDENATAFANRDAHYILNVVGTWVTPDEEEAHKTWARRTYSSLDTVGSDAGYVNFLEEEPGRLHSVYPDRTLARLREVKRRVDPDNVFRGNVPITSAVAS